MSTPVLAVGEAVRGGAVFPPGSEGFDMSQLLQQAQRMQEQLVSAQRDLAESEAVGTAGGGLVRATVTGAGELRALEIDPSVVDPTDVETLADLVVAAVRDAQNTIQQRASDQLGAIDPSLEGLLGGAGAGALPDLLGGSPTPGPAAPDTSDAADESRDDATPPDHRA